MRKWLEKKLGIDLLRRKQTGLDGRLKVLERLVDVGVDVHVRSNSWAVVCIGGSREYVKFYTLGRGGHDNDLHALLNFLRDMKRAGVIIDAEPNMPDFIRRETWA